MKRFMGALVAFAFGSLAASAADLAVKAPPQLPAPVLSWTGFYVGINGGAAAMNGPSMSYVDGAINAYVPVTVDPSSSVKLSEASTSDTIISCRTTGSSASKVTG